MMRRPAHTRIKVMLLRKGKKLHGCHDFHDFHCAISTRESFGVPKPMAPVNQGLGMHVDLSGVQQGTVTLAPTAKRVESVLSALRLARARDELLPAEGLGFRDPTISPSHHFTIPTLCH